MTKPFSPEEVVARRALMRRTAVATDQGASLLVVGDLTMDEDSHEVTRGSPGHPDRHRVRAVALPHAQPQARAVQGADPRSGLNYDFGGQANVVEPTSPTCARRSTPARVDDPHMRGVGYVLKPAP